MPASGRFEYRYEVAGPGSPDWQIDSLSMPVPATATIADLLTPTGWSVDFATGSNLVTWHADSPSNALGSGHILVFGLSSDLPASRQCTGYRE